MFSIGVGAPAASGLRGLANGVVLLMLARTVSAGTVVMCGSTRWWGRNFAVTRVRLVS